MVVGEFTQETDLLVIGGGPAGYSAAFRAAELGVPTTIVDPRESLGGVCLHAGCVPSKTLAHVVSIANLIPSASVFGIDASINTVDTNKTDAWVEGTVARLAQGLASRASKLGVQILTGTARFEDGKHVAVSGGSVPRVKFRRAVIATGARPRALDALPFDNERIIPPEKAMRIGTLPRRTLVVGSDYMAVECASIYAGLGSETSLLCEEASILPEADADVRRLLERSFQASLASFRTETDVHASSADGFDRVIVANGVVPNTGDLNLSATKIQVAGDGWIPVDDELRTDDPRLFAVGDVTGEPMLAHKAIAQGRAAGEVIAGRTGSAFDARAIPMAIFSDPQVAWVGVTEAGASEEGIEVAATRVLWGQSGRAAGMNRAAGLTRIIYDPESKLVLGAAIVGEGACEMIAEAALAIEMGAELADLAMTLHPHPTMCEMMSDAAREAMGS